MGDFLAQNIDVACPDDAYIRGDESIFAEFDGDGDVHNKLMTTMMMTMMTTMTTTLMMVKMMMMIAVSPHSPAGPMSAGPNIQRSLHCLSHCSLSIASPTCCSPVVGGYSTLLPLSTASPTCCTLLALLLWERLCVISCITPPQGSASHSVGHIY